MKAVIQETGKTINSKHRKENKYSGALIGLAVIDNRIATIIEARFYWTEARCYCCVWLHGNIYTAGSGYAGGYGYHMQSQALENALNNAGIILSKGIGGVGRNAEEEAIQAILDEVCPSDTITKVLRTYG